MTTTPAARTATFLMTDIERSTRLWEERREAMAVALAGHDALLRTAVEQAGGRVVKTTGDGLLAAFDHAESGLTAAINGQHALDRNEWRSTGPLHVRMAIHSGSAEVRNGDFFGPALNRVARLLAIGHGDEVLVSGTTAALVAAGLPPACELIDLGEHRLRDLDRPEHVYQLVAPGLRREFPPLRTTSEHPTNLRPQGTSFVGRERELADLGRLLATSRLVTLVGVGGTGKTRLESFAFLALARGHDVRAARLFGAAEALREVAEAQMTALEREEYHAAILRLRDALDEGARRSAWAEGRQMTADAAVAFALSE